jgi:glycosyltransferase involved in cell wall biosynthesis
VTTGPRATLAVVIPAYNEEAALALLHPRLAAALDAVDLDARILYVDDGSRDRTWDVLREIAARDARVELLRLSRNFGKELALTAGLDRVDADAVLVLDADGQDPPELLPEFVARWRAGADVVYGKRQSRAGEGWLKRGSAHAFYRVINRLSDTDIPADTGDYRLVSRRVIEALRGLRERQRFMKGLFAWVGYPQVELAYQREARIAGRSKFNFWRLWNFALEGITGFSTVPLRVATYVGVASAALAFAYGLWVVAKTLLWGDPVQGWPTLMVVILFLGGVQLVALGVIGEYLGRLYLESKQRPLYLVRDWHRAGSAGAVEGGRPESGRPADAPHAVERD